MNNSQLATRNSQLARLGGQPATRNLSAVTDNSPPATPTLNQLRQQIRAVETENRRNDGSIIKHGCEALDRLLPEGGYSRGILVQWITCGGLGVEYLSLRVAQQACLAGGALVIADPCKEFFPPAAAAMGIDLDHLILLQTSDEKDLLWGIDQALRCPAVGAVWGRIDVIDERQFRRFQLSAESSGALGLFLQPYHAARKPSWAEVQWLVGMHPSSPRSLQRSAEEASDWRPVSLQLTRCRGTFTGKSIRVRIDPVTGAIHHVSTPVSTAPDSRANTTTNPQMSNQQRKTPAVPNNTQPGRTVYEERLTPPPQPPLPAPTQLSQPTTNRLPVAS